jgi:hypothetical protein
MNLFSLLETYFSLLFGFFDVLTCCSLYGDDDYDDGNDWAPSLTIVFRLLQTGSWACFGFYVYLYLALCVHSACGLPRFGSLAKSVETI